MIDEPDEPELPMDGEASPPLPEQGGNKGPHRFRKGKSGNPNGRPAGSRNKASIIVEKMMGDQAEAVVQATIKRALEGSTDAMKLILDRLAPIRRDRPITFSLPDKLDDLPALHGAVLEAVAAGELAPSEAAAVATVINARQQAIEVVKLAERLAAIEDMQKGN